MWITTVVIYRELTDALLSRRFPAKRLPDMQADLPGLIDTGRDIGLDEPEGDVGAAHPQLDRVSDVARVQGDFQSLAEARSECHVDEADGWPLGREGRGREVRLVAAVVT